MAELTETGVQCRAKVGMLVLRDCSSQAVAACDVCGRPICKFHLTRLGNQVSCPECAVENPQARRERPVRRARRRRRWYRGYGYRPYYYGPYYHHYYSDHDYRTLSSTERVDETGAADEAGMATADELDDADADAAFDLADDES
jgi:hypothetical protein